MNQSELEFRFALHQSTLARLTLNPVKLSFTDYYLAREQRIRWFQRHPDPGKDDAYFLISNPPGMVVKQYSPLAGDEARAVFAEKKIQYLVRHVGIGEVMIAELGVTGFAENIAASKTTDEKIIFDEIHIEFENCNSQIRRLAEIINPLKIIRVGVYDYIREYEGPPV